MLTPWKLHSWDVNTMENYTVGMWTLWKITQLGCGYFGKLHNWDVDTLENYTVGMLTLWKITQLEC